MLELSLLCAFSLLAGFVDAAVGGGGLIQLPAALILLPGVAVPSVLGTNKFASFFGTSFAVQRYARAVQMDWPTIAPAALAAFVCALGGSRVVTLLNPALLRPLVLALLVLVALYVFFVKDLGLVHAPKHSPRQRRWLAIAIGSLLGFYDGFFGPGMGSFLIFAFVGILGFDFLAASASAKAINWCTNLASILYFASTGQLLYGVALAMAASNVLGAALGSYLAIRQGSRFVRILFLIVVSGLIIKLTQTILWP
ncbi:MAG: TSUP family transporter [Chthoniobacterales bacterium]